MATISKNERVSINNTKCALALEKGYKYDRATGEIIGLRNKPIKAHINGYTIISFVVDGKRMYLYGTTFIEYILKSENDSISAEDIELAKTYVKPSAVYLAAKKALKEAKKQKALVDGTIQEIIPDNPDVNLVDKSLNFNWKKMKFRKGVKKNRRQKRLMA